MKSLFTIVSSLALAGSGLAAQEGSTPSPDQPAPPKVIEQEAAAATTVVDIPARVRAQEVLASKNWSTGYDPEKKRGIMIGYASIPPLKKGQESSWIAARNRAFDEAMFDAKQQLVEFLSLEISSRMSRIMGDDEEGVAALESAKSRADQLSTSAPALEGMSAMDKIQYAATQELDSFMKDRGYEIGDPSKEAKAEMEKFFVTYKDTIEKAASATAQSETAGLLAYQVFESRSEVAVIAIFHEGSSVALARAMLGVGSVPRKADKKKENALAYVMGLYRDGSLPFTQGVRMRRDENGDLSLYAFAHYLPERPTKRGVDKAKGLASLECQRLLRAFAGESITSARDSLSLATYSEAENLAGEYEEQFESYDTYSQNLSAVAKSLALPGISMAWQGEVDHPTVAALGLKQRVQVAVAKYNITAAKDAVALKKRFNALAGSKGGGGVAAAEAAKEAEAKAKAKKGTIRPAGGNGDGAGGDDDDLGGGL